MRIVVPVTIVATLLAACTQSVSVPCDDCAEATVCTTRDDCAVNEVCFEGVCAVSAAPPDDVVLPRPALIDLDFTRDAMPVEARLERATSASTIDSGGVLRSVDASTARFERDRRFGVRRGVLVEPATTNLCDPSEDLIHPRWWSARTQRTVNAATAPDGTMTAVRLSPSVTLEYHSVGYDPGVEPGVTYVFSIFLKAGELSEVYVGIGGNGGYPSQLLNLADGTLSQINALEAIVDAGVIDMGNGWHRAWVAFTRAGFDDSVNVMLELGLMPANPDVGLYAWGCQIERGAVPTSYVGSTKGGLRDADRLSLTDPALLDVGADFTLLVVQSLDIAGSGTPATSLVVRGIGSTNVLKLGQRAAGNASLVIERESGLLPLNLATGSAWRDGELHVVAVSRRGEAFVLVDNGVSVRGGSNELPASSAPAALLAIGQPVAGGTAPTRIRRVVVWQEALDEATLVQMTRP